MRAIFVLAVLLAGTGAALAAPLIGFTLTHTEVHCEPGSTAPKLVASANILLNYSKPDIRARAITELTAMRREGADATRMLIWFVTSNPSAKPLAELPLGPFHADASGLPQSAIDNLRAYIADVKRLGYRTLFLAIGPEGRGSPSCRGDGVWGECFDPNSLAVSWTVIAQVRRAIEASDTRDFRVLLDIAHERCPSVGGAFPTAQTVAQYTHAMVANYARTFDDHRYLVSCSGGPTAPIAGFEQRLDALSAIVAQSGVEPAGYDLHIYYTEPGDIDRALETGESLAERTNTTLFVLESYAEDPVLPAEIARLRKAGRLARLQAVAVWPRTKDSACGTSLTAPYPLGALRDIR